MCKRRKRQREKSLFEVEMERLRVVLLVKRQRLKLDAMTVVSWPNGGAAEGDAGVQAARGRCQERVAGARG